jgi:hypothetical protein
MATKKQKARAVVSEKPAPPAKKQSTKVKKTSRGK